MRAMNTSSPTPTEPTTLEAACASTRAWLVRLVALIVDVLQYVSPTLLAREIRFLARLAERHAAELIFMRAGQRVRFGAPRASHAHFHAAPSGFRLARTRGSYGRRFTHGLVSRRGTIEERLERVLTLLADGERAVRRALARLLRGLTPCSLVATAPPALVLASAALPRSPQCADSS